MKTPVVEYQSQQFTLDFDLDRPQFSICPQCDSKVIRLIDGCDVCGWCENQSHSVWPYSIPCTVKQPKQPERSLNFLYLIIISKANQRDKIFIVTFRYSCLNI